MSREHQPRDGRRPDDEKHDEKHDESHNDARIDAFNEELLEDRDATPVVEALVATLDTAPPSGEPLTPDGWETLRARLAVEQNETAADGSDERLDDVRFNGHPGTTENDRRQGPTAAPATAGPPPVRGTSASRWIVATVLVAAVVAAGSWGALQAGEAAKLRDDQRILAYWMSNPDMRMVSLTEPGSSPQGAADEVGEEPLNQASADNPRLGIICFLPDGRALLLQPSRAPRGASYVVMGVGAAGTEELARGRANMLQFDTSGMQSVEVVLARGRGDNEVVARAALN